MKEVCMEGGKVRKQKREGEDVITALNFATLRCYSIKIDCGEARRDASIGFI
jgi:hypothetical protein